MTKQPILIMAGGTGGHVYPALAVAHDLIEKGIEVTWMGTRRGLEARVVPAAGISIEWLSIGGLRGKNIFTLLLAPFKVLFACVQAGFILKRIKPSMVLGMGGFAAGPGGLMAKLFGIPLVVHEQNAVAGLTNKVLSRMANAVLQAFPKTFSDNITPLSAGNPVRKEIIEAGKQKQMIRSDRLRLLIIGGSLGATALNTLLPKAIETLPRDLYPDIWHQTGSAQQADVEAMYAQLGVSAKVTAFIDDMAEAYKWADLAVCRAGAMTIAELAMMGLPAILIPFPYAVDDHQTANARYLSDAGAALLLQQKTLSKEVLGDHISALAVDFPRLQGMSNSAKQLAKPEATQVLVRQCLFWSGAYHGI